jgi:hypothetical protein
VQETYEVWSKRSVGTLTYNLRDAQIHLHSFYNKFKASWSNLTVKCVLRSTGVHQERPFITVFIDARKKLSNVSMIYADTVLLISN